ncbi:site-2 protease family protein [Amycolatopsis panacis]|uniref:Site-2 protease family protein n=1 Tax=Amycolatopsis panacis TaxID=2340917 RepID=A0A419HQ41_9PSEU|nr:site-2 protease family protein [Amycolatopsis panacis]RJQ78530.1 site-2 protease family protein [Amycolatopsis panacis]
MRPSPIFLGILAVSVAGGFLAAYGDSSTLLSSRDPMFVAGVVLLVAGGWIASLTLHEFGHAFVAFRGGDHEVARKGYLSLDVRRYTDPVLSLLLPLIFLLIGGIPLPGGAVWINRGALRSRATSSWVSLAGPLSNLAVGAALCLVVALVPMATGLFYALSYLALLQVMTFLLNILPVPGLDGWGALEPYLSPQARMFGARVRPWAPLALFALFFVFRPAGDLLWSVAGKIFMALGGSSPAAAVGQTAFLFWR